MAARRLNLLNDENPPPRTQPWLVAVAGVTPAMLIDPDDPDTVESFRMIDQDLPSECGDGVVGAPPERLEREPDDSSDRRPGGRRQVRYQHRHRDQMHKCGEAMMGLPQFGPAIRERNPLVSKLAWIVPLVAMVPLLAWVPNLLGWLFGYSPADPPLLSVLATVGAVLMARLLTSGRTRPVRAGVCLALGVSVHFGYPYPSEWVSDFGWFVGWSVYSGALWIISLGSFSVGWLGNDKRTQTP